MARATKNSRRKEINQFFLFLLDIRTNIDKSKTSDNLIYLLLKLQF